MRIFNPDNDQFLTLTVGCWEYAPPLSVCFIVWRCTIWFLARSCRMLSELLDHCIWIVEKSRGLWTRQEWILLLLLLFILWREQQRMSSAPERRSSESRRIRPHIVGIFPICIPSRGFDGAFTKPGLRITENRCGSSWKIRESRRSVRFTSAGSGSDATAGTVHREAGWSEPSCMPVWTYGYVCPGNDRKYHRQPGWRGSVDGETQSYGASFS